MKYKRSFDRNIKITDSEAYDNKCKYVIRRDYYSKEQKWVLVRFGLKNLNLYSRYPFEKQVPQKLFSSYEDAEKVLQKILNDE